MAEIMVADSEASSTPESVYLTATKFNQGIFSLREIGSTSIAMFAYRAALAGLSDLVNTYQEILEKDALALGSGFGTLVCTDKRAAQGMAKKTNSEKREKVSSLDKDRTKVDAYQGNHFKGQS